MNATTRKYTILSAPLLLALAACSSADLATDADGEDFAAVSEHAVVLATFTPSDQQTIQVVAYGDELIGLSEWRGAGFDPETEDSLLNLGSGSIADLYARVAGAAVDHSVLERMRKFEARGVRVELPAQVGRAAVDSSSLAENLDESSLASAAASRGPATRTLGLDCAKDDAYYNHYSSGWAGTHCRNPPGWEDWWCRTNQPDIRKDWTHAEDWSVVFHNMSSCNTAVGWVHARRPGKFVGLGGPRLGPNQGWSGWWYVNSRDWKWYTGLRHESGNEQAHLNMATYRKW